MAISPECFVCFQWDPQMLKQQPFNLNIAMKNITQFIRSKFGWPKCKKHF